MFDCLLFICLKLSSLHLFFNPASEMLILLISINFGSTLPLDYIKQKDFFPFNVTSRNILPFSRPAWTVRRENIAQAVEEVLLNLSAR